MQSHFKLIFSGLFYYLLLSPITAQYTVTTFQDPLQQAVEMHQFNDPFAFTIQYVEAPHPTSESAMKAFLRAQKLEAQRLTPYNPEVNSSHRGIIPTPDILASFSGNSVIAGTPLDNHLAIGPDELVVSTINTNMLVTNNVGFWMGSYRLNEFFASLATNNRFFDPRVIYDPELDRFILVLINGSDCINSQILLAFSQTNNPRGAWNLYAIDGCLDDDGTFADYPMIAITKSELFLTYNEVNGDSSWQTGFSGTQIHQINKMKGFNGETLNRKVWRDISYNGRFLRNICPVRNADEAIPTSMYFLSNRNFDISNDTIFLMHLTGQQDDPNATLDISYRVSDQAYGVPPYAVQTRDSMDTNDGRVLDAFELNGRIQWVSNTMDFKSGKSAIFHGALFTDDPSMTAIGNIVVHPTDYLGYPGIAWTGNNPSEQDAIIVVSHCSAIRHPGGSAVYSDGLGQYSDFVTIIEGQRSVDMLTGPIERWGDYMGIQRHYNQPGSVWVSCSYGRPGNINEGWIAKLARHEEMTATHDNTSANQKITTYPNPTHDRVSIELDNPDGKNIKVFLYDATGTLLNILYEGPAQYPGKSSIHFSTQMLPVGQYLVRVNLDHVLIATQQVIKL